MKFRNHLNIYDADEFCNCLIVFLLTTFIWCSANLNAEDASVLLLYFWVMVNQIYTECSNLTNYLFSQWFYYWYTKPYKLLLVIYFIFQVAGELPRYVIKVHVWQTVTETTVTSAAVPVECVMKMCRCLRSRRNLVPQFQVGRLKWFCAL